MMTYNFKENYEALVAQLSELKAECKSILKTHPVKTEKELYKLTSIWQEKVGDCIKTNINPYPDFLIEHFKQSSYPGIRNELFYLHNPETEEDKKERYTRIIGSKLWALRILEDYLLILKSIEKEQVAIQTIKEKSDYIMDKLYLVFNDNLYSIEYLLRLNAVSYRHGEPAELGTNLRKKGYIEVANEYDKNHIAKLTVKGAAYVERRMKSESKKRVLKKEKELSEKVDAVLEKLQSLGYGQEIIFQEIEELKSLSGKLKKRTWIQLLKGKVVDLAMDQVINKETATYILETFSEEASKLLPK